MGKEKFRTLCSVLQLFCKQIMNLLLYSVPTIMSNHSKTNDQNSVGSLTRSPHPANRHTDAQEQRENLICGQ